MTTTQEILLKLGVQTLKEKGITAAIEIGNHLFEIGYDNICHLGYWILNVEKNEIFYSPNFRKSIGYENEIDFPNTIDSYINSMTEDSSKNAVEKLELAIKNHTKYSEDVTYISKGGEEVHIHCIGKQVEEEKLNFIIGIHKIL